MNPLTPTDVLKLVPQQRPMRFIDDILEIDEEHVLATYTWKDEDCAGHFPGNPVVPGVKLIEMAAQVGNVAWAVYHITLTEPPEVIGQLVGFFTEVESGSFKKMVRPGEKVAAMATFGDDGYYRSYKLRAHVEIQFDGGPKDGETIFTGSLSGMWVPKSSEALR